jgi:predicted metal-dependent phosphoesterase TrpH
MHQILEYQTHNREENHLQIVENIFVNKPWELARKDENNISFKRNNSEYDFIEVINDKNKNKIFVTIPLKLNGRSYTTHFSSYDDASKYIEMHVKNM